MGNRFFLWLASGVVAAGVTVGMLAGAGVAYGQTEGDGDGGAKTSQSAKPADNQQDSDQDETGQKQQSTQNVGDDKTDTPGTVADDDPDATVDRDAVNEDTGRKPRRSEAGKQTAKVINNVVVAITRKPDRKAVVGKTREADPVEKADPAETVDAVEARTAVITDDPATPVRPTAFVEKIFKAATSSPALSDITLATPMLANAEVTEAATPPLRVPPILSAIGTLVFGLISFGESLFEGPPMALPGSGVTVKRSTLVIGDQEVPADWYFPETLPGGTPPEHIIYLQHGFLARGVFYDYTASYLAEQTNSIVVAPTLTSNIFATDGMWLGGTQMHRAVADLFLDDNTALLDSAQQAGFPEGEQLPDQVVLVGHSLGGGLVIDTARYMAAEEANGDSAYELAGVLMLDGVSFTDPEPILRDIPEGIPVYNLSATPYVWNLFGGMDAALAEVRGDQFHGAQLLGGLHSDSMIGGNPLVQFGAYLFTGFSLPSNVEGSQVLAAGWINDMFAGTQTCTETSCFYGEPGTSFTVPTRFGPARALVQPEPGVVDSLARQLTAVAFGLLANINFATCAAPDTQGTGVFQELSVQNTRLSLDGRAPTGQSVGQHVCTG